MLNYYASIDLDNKIITLFDIVKCRRFIKADNIELNTESIEKEIKDIGLLIYNLKEENFSIIDGILNNKGEKFKNVFDCADFILKNNLSSATKNRIISTINRNLNGSTKTAYGYTWKYNLIEFDIENLKDFKIITDALYF